MGNDNYYTILNAMKTNTKLFNNATNQETQHTEHHLSQRTSQQTSHLTKIDGVATCIETFDQN